MTNESLLDQATNATNYVFVFLEIFAQEGGIQSYVKDVLQAYLEFTADDNNRAEVFLLRDDRECNNLLETDRLKFHYLKTHSPWKGRLKLAASVFKCLVQRHPQHVFCGHINLAVLIKTLCIPLGIPYTVMTYGKEVWHSLPAQQRQALQKATSIWTISRYSRDRLCEANKIDPKKVQILPCVVDGEVFTPDPKPQALREKYGLADAKVLMTVARLWSGDPYKGVDVTIRALPKIHQEFPVKYLVIGRGDDQPRLVQLAKELGVADQVIFAGFVPNRDLPDHYRVADVYVMPSQEGFGIVYLEAMACGIPVLAGNADGSADPLQDGRLGWQIPHRDPEAVARACVEILKGDDQRCNGRWLREQVLAHFSKQALGEKLQQLLDPNNRTSLG